MFEWNYRVARMASRNQTAFMSKAAVTLVASPVHFSVIEELALFHLVKHFGGVGLANFTQTVFCRARVQAADGVPIEWQFIR
jgi:hypothetical protein